MFVVLRADFSKFDVAGSWYFLRPFKFRFASIKRRFPADFGLEKSREDYMR